ncbi:hypothetical protein T439DRAFT_136565 [Meredithblackwellia eburnea MCA 4105]
MRSFSLASVATILFFSGSFVGSTLAAYGDPGHCAQPAQDNSGCFDSDTVAGGSLAFTTNKNTCASAADDAVSQCGKTVVNGVAQCQATQTTCLAACDADNQFCKDTCSNQEQWCEFNAEGAQSNCLKAVSDTFCGCVKYTCQKTTASSSSSPSTSSSASSTSQSATPTSKSTSQSTCTALTKATLKERDLSGVKPIHLGGLMERSSIVGGGCHSAALDLCSNGVLQANDQTSSGTGCGTKSTLGVPAISSSLSALSSTFDDACNVHNSCFTTCSPGGSTFAKCNRSLFSTLVSACSRVAIAKVLNCNLVKGTDCWSQTTKLSSQCQSDAKAIYVSLSGTTGCTAYGTSQTGACDCCSLWVNTGARK